MSDRVLERIDSMLGHPTADPHGDPIPGLNGHVEDHFGTSLADCPLKQPQRVSRIRDQDPEFLRFVERQGLAPGATVSVQQRESSAGVIVFRAGRRDASSIGLPAAAKILVADAPKKNK